MAENVIIIGSGPAGLSAAVYTAREGFSPLVISGTVEGGQLLLTTNVENYPGFPDGIDGPELIDMMRKQAERQGARFVHENATDLDLMARPFRVSAGGKTYETETLIIATGADSVWLGIESEKKFIGKGMSSCATCDGPFFKAKDVAVVGGGDTAMEDSLFLTKFANSVTIIHRRSEFRASKIMQDRVLSNSKIKVIWDSAVEELLGDTKVGGVRIKDLKTGNLRELKIDGLFVAIGHKPNTDFLKGKIKLDDKGYVVVKNIVETDIEGVFIGGDVADPLYRQAVTAAGTGTMCALRVREYLQNKKPG
jgi:thioredoxin-disulfide reductase